jgi:hypothetical protein
VLGGRQLVTFSLRFLGQDLHRDESLRGSLGRKGAGHARKQPKGLQIHRASAGADFVTCQDSETTANHLRPPANCDLQQPNSTNRIYFLAKHHYCNAGSIALTRSPPINQLVSGRQGELCEAPRDSSHQTALVLESLAPQARPPSLHLLNFISRLRNEPLHLSSRLSSYLTPILPELIRVRSSLNHNIVSSITCGTVN